MPKTSRNGTAVSGRPSVQEWTTLSGAWLQAAPTLYAGGNFDRAGGVTAHSIAKWNGSAWSALGPEQPGSVTALAVSGGDLYAAGDRSSTTDGVSTNHVAKWNGSAWSALGSGMDNHVDALAVSGGRLFAGGSFC